MTILSKKQMDMINGKDSEWEPEPPPEGGYEVIRIYPYGEDADVFAERTTEMARHDPDIAAISAAGVGFPLDKEEITSVQLGGLGHDGRGNLILELRGRRKEVLEAERKERAVLIQGKIDELISDLTAQVKQDDSNSENSEEVTDG